MDLDLTVNSAVAGNHDAFEQLIELYRREVFVHCYRMLGSVQDAEDVLQDAILRAWEHLQTFTGQGTFRAWLYRIATNLCLDELRRVKRRALIQADTPMCTASSPNEAPLTEEVWLEPLPNSMLSIEQCNPEGLYTQRESVQLAFISALHKLSARHRAILLLRDVLGWRAREVADYLEITESAVNSTLFRARKLLDESNVKKQKNSASPALIQSFLQQYIAAWESNDVSRLTHILKEDVILNMPPFPAWYQGRQNLEAFLIADRLLDPSVVRWKATPIEVNGQPGIAIYKHIDGYQTYRFGGIHVLTIGENCIERIDYFVTDAAPYLPEPLPAPWFPFFSLPTDQ